VKILLQYYAGTRSPYIQEGRQDKGRKTAPPEPVLGDSVMSGRLLISGRHLILTDLLVGVLQLGRIRVMRSSPSVCAQTFLLPSFSRNAPLERLNFTVYMDHFNSSDLIVQSRIHICRRSAVCSGRGLRTDGKDDFRRSLVPEGSVRYLIGYLEAQERER